MAKLNKHFQKLPDTYIFPIIEKKLENQDKSRVLNLGVGDVSLPLVSGIAQAMQAALEEMTTKTRGYGPSDGYPFLRETICAHEYAEYGLTPEEIFISDGANSDAASIQELFSSDTTVLIPDPTYPVYRDASLIAGKKVLFLPTTEEEGFIPKPPNEPADIVYLCTPCNPTGVALNHEDLQEWIDWAKKHKAILLIDNVYNQFISSDDIPPSIYSLPDGKEVAIEIRSFSKSAGFTGLRCGYIVVPKTLHHPELHPMWARRVAAKSNGVSYPIQCGGAATFQPEIRAELNQQIQTYLDSGKLLRAILEEMGQTFFGGVHSPYIFWKVPPKMSSWDFFDHLLSTCQILAIPGSGFGPSGEGYIRFSSFITQETATKAANALRHLTAPV